MSVDSPILGGWKAQALRAAKQTQLVGSISPGAISRKRKNRWPSREAALEHFRHKKAFARWEPQVLSDYITHGTHDEDGERVLSFDRDISKAHHIAAARHGPADGLEDPPILADAFETVCSPASHMAKPLFDTELQRNSGLYEADMPVQLVLVNALSSSYTC